MPWNILVMHLRRGRSWVFQTRVKDFQWCQSLTSSLGVKTPLILELLGVCAHRPAPTLLSSDIRDAFRLESQMQKYHSFLYTVSSFWTQFWLGLKNCRCDSSHKVDFLHSAIFSSKLNNFGHRSLQIIKNIDFFSLFCFIHTHTIGKTSDI